MSPIVRVHSFARFNAEKLLQKIYLALVFGGKHASEIVATSLGVYDRLGFG
jgi:hypothetical protein